MPDGHADPALPRVVGNARECAELAAAPAGIRWKLAEPDRQLDANVVHLPPRRRVDTHAEPDLDVLLVVLAGEGTLDSAAAPQSLTEGSLLWLPRGSRRGLAAGEEGLSYLTMHRRRAGMQIRRRDQTADPWSASAGHRGQT